MKPRPASYIKYRLDRFRLGGSSWMAELPEFIGEAIMSIGIGVAPEPVWEKVDIVDYKARLPCKDFQIITIQYNDKHYRKVSDVRGAKHGANYGWSLTPHYIITHVEDGDLYIKYNTIPIDNDGEPLIHGEFNYVEAVTFYCLAQLLLQGYKHPDFNYDKAMQFHNRYRDKAVNKSKLLSADDYSNFAYMWLNSFQGRDMVKDFSSSPAYEANKGWKGMNTDNKSTYPEDENIL